MYLENEGRRNKEKQINVSCHIFQCSNFLACFIPDFLFIVLGACLVLQDSKCPCLIKLHKEPCSLCWSQNEIVGHFSHYISEVET